MIIVYNGRMRSGKGFGLALNAYNHWMDGYTVISNMDFYFGRQTPGKRIPVNLPLDFQQIESCIESGKPLTHVVGNSKVLLVIDELPSAMDSRKSLTGTNVIMSWFAAQSAKTHVDMAVSTQKLGMIDLRMRDFAHFIVNCDKAVFTSDNPDEHLEKYIHHFEYEIYDNGGDEAQYIGTMQIGADLALKLGEMFDTQQGIPPMKFKAR